MNGTLTRDHLRRGQCSYAANPIIGDSGVSPLTRLLFPGSGGIVAYGDPNQGTVELRTF